MRRMDQVGVSVGIRMESQEETVRQSLLQPFGTAIRSPFVPFDQVYLGGKCTESIFDFLDLLGGYFWLETEHDNVAKHFLLLGSIAATEHQGRECQDCQ